MMVDFTSAWPVAIKVLGRTAQHPTTPYLSVSSPEAGVV